MGRKNKPYSDKSAPYATMASSPDDYLYKKGKKQKLVGSADNSPEDGEEELEESGYRYERDEEVEFDGNNSKIWHYLITPDGERFTIDHSPYQEISPEEFDKYVEEFRRSSLKETNMTDELNELRKAAGLPIVEDCDQDVEKNDDGECSPFTHADENVAMVREYEEEFEPATNMCPECEGVGEVAGKACEHCHGEGEIFEGEVEEDFLAPPKDVDNGAYEDDPYADETNIQAFDRDMSDSEPFSDDYPLDEAPSRQDFRMVADTLMWIEDEDVRRAQAEEYAKKFAAANPRFNKEIFMNAAGVDYVEEDANTHVGREFASSEFGGEGGNTHVGREFASSEMAEDGWADENWPGNNDCAIDEQGPGDDEFAHDDDAMVDIGDGDDFSGDEDLSDFGGEYYGDSQYYETIEMNELRKAAGLEQVNEGKGLVDLSRWYEYEHGDVMSQIYWQKSQLPPSRPSAYARNWEKVVRNLSKKYPPPEGWVNPVEMPEPEEQTCPVCRGRGVNYSQNDEPCYKCDGEGTIIESMNEGQQDADGLVFFNFNNEQAYFMVADELGSEITFGMNNEVGIPGHEADRITDLLVSSGFDATRDFSPAPVGEDMQNGYNDKRYADGNDFFPRGSHQSPSDDLGPTASGYGDNAMKNKMRSKETDAVYESMRQSYRRFRKS